MNKFLVLCTLLISTTAVASDWSVFDEKPLYKEPYAHVRSPDTGITINTSRYLGERVGYLEAAIGKNIPILSAQHQTRAGQKLRIQIGLAAGFWATLGYDDGAFPLLTQDFLISIPVELKYGNFSGAIKYNHISAHLGDGFNGLLEGKLSEDEQNDLDTAEDMVEDFTGDEDTGITLKEPFNYSRDFLSGHVAYDYKVGVFNNRSYAHIGYAHRMFPDNLGRWFFGSGFEAVHSSGIFAPYYAQDVTYNQDTDSVDLSSEFGAVILSDKTKHYTVRVAITMFVGYDRRGQLLGRKMKQFGMGFFID